MRLSDATSGQEDKILVQKLPFLDFFNGGSEKSAVQPFSPNCIFGKPGTFDRFFSTATLITALTGNVYVDTGSNK